MWIGISKKIFCLVKNKHVIIKGLAGFGNRVLTLSAAIEYAKKSNRKVIVDWCDNMYAPMGENSFYKIFQPRKAALGFIEIDIVKADANDVYPKIFKGRLDERLYNLAMPHKVTDSFKTKFTRRMSKKVLGNSCFLKINHDLKLYQIFNSSFVFPYGKNLSIKLKQDTVVYGDFIDDKGFNAFFETFEFLPHFQHEILSKLSSGNERLNYGFHIRGTDFGEDMNKVDLLIDKLKSGYINNEAFYLATDSRRIKESFQESFGSLARTNESELPETNGVGIHNYLRKQSGELANQSRLDLGKDMINLISVKQFYGHKKSTLSAFISDYRLNNGLSAGITWNDLLN